MSTQERATVTIQLPRGVYGWLEFVSAGSKKDMKDILQDMVLDSIAKSYVFLTESAMAEYKLDR